MPSRIAASVMVMTWAAGAWSAPEIKVTAGQLVETRVKDAARRSGVIHLAGIELTLHVEGLTATQYGDVKVTEAIDDTGKDLRPDEKSMLGEDGFKPIGDDASASGSGFDVTVRLAPATRKAASIRSLKGEFQVLAGGESKSVDVKSIMSKLGQKLNEPALKSAGLEVKVLDPSKPGVIGGDFALELSGDESALQEVLVLDANGQEMNHGLFSAPADGKRMMGFSLQRAPDDKTSVRLKLLVGQKKTTVPFELKDVKLP